MDQIVWDLKYPPPSFQNNERDTEGLTKPDKSQLLPIPPHGLDPEGPDVSPGTYLVTISAGNDSFSQKVKVNGDPKLDLKAGDYRKRELFLIDLHAFHEKVFVKNNELKETVKEYEKTMDEDDEELKNMKALQKKVNTIRWGIFSYLFSQLLLDVELTQKGFFILLLCAGLWMTEIVPLPVTALFVPVLAYFLGILGPKAAMAPFSNTIIFLFMGGFTLAALLNKHGIDLWLANKVTRLSKGRLWLSISG